MVREPASMLDVTLDEFERQLVATKLRKAPGEDGSPSIDRRRMWPIVKDMVLALFRQPLSEVMPPPQQ